jgi:hypothetical protein
MPVRSCAVRARGKNHAAAMIATALLVLAPLAAPRAQDDPALAPMPDAAAPAAVSFTQTGVPAEATAENGVVARERALANGRRAAWERIASAAGVTRSLSDAQIEAMTRSIIIEEERTSPTRYTGRITVNFNPGRARSYLGGGAGVAEGGGAPGGGTPAEGTADRRPQGPVTAAATVEMVALYGSLNEWLELRRRLTSASARMEVVAISTDRARLRVGLRSPPGVAAQELAVQGITMRPGSGAPGDAWRVGLAGRS